MINHLMMDGLAALVLVQQLEVLEVPQLARLLLHLVVLNIPRTEAGQCEGRCVVRWARTAASEKLDICFLLVFAVCASALSTKKTSSRLMGLVGLVLSAA